MLVLQKELVIFVAVDETIASWTRCPPATAGRSNEACPQTGDFVDSLINSGRGSPTDFSVTVGSRDRANMKDAHYEAVATYLQPRAVRGVLSLERGKEKGNLHCQGVMTFGLMRSYSDGNKLNVATAPHARVRTHVATTS